MRDCSDWMLNQQIFQQIQNALGPLHVDLFASRLTAQLPCFFSWRPDPLAEATNALLQNWEEIQGYANPPWNLLGRVLAKVKKNLAQRIVQWHQSGRPSLVPDPSGPPDRLPQENSSTGGLLETAESELPVVIPLLAAWLISGRGSRQRAFQKALILASWRTKSSRGL